MNALALTLHLLAAVVWIGGMFFAYIIIRPSVANYEPARRLELWQSVFTKFFPWVKLCIVVLLVTGYYMLFSIYKGFANAPVFVHIMHLIGWVMFIKFFVMFKGSYQQFKKAVAAEDWASAAAPLNKVRLMVLANLSLGIILLIVVGAGRYI